MAKLSGHSELETIYGHYLRVSNETIGRAANLLNQMRDLSEGSGAASFDVEPDKPDLIN